MCTLAAAWIYLVLKLSISKRGGFDEDFILANTSLLWHCYEARENKRTMSSMRELCVYYKKHSSMDKKRMIYVHFNEPIYWFTESLKSMDEGNTLLIMYNRSNDLQYWSPEVACLWSLKRGLFSLAISWVFWLLIVSSDFQKPHKSPFI